MKARSLDALTQGHSDPGEEGPAPGLERAVETHRWWGRASGGNCRSRDSNSKGSRGGGAGPELAGRIPEKQGHLRSRGRLDFTYMPEKEAEVPDRPLWLAFA